VPLHGRHNVANALGALATAASLGVPVPEAAAALARFRGVRRRQEVRGEAGGVTVIDDFAHHPTAVLETVAAMRTRYPGRRLVAVLEPRSNTVAARSSSTNSPTRWLAPIVSSSRSSSRAALQRDGEVTEYLDAARIAADLRSRRSKPRHRRRARDRRRARGERRAGRRRARDEQRRVRGAVDEAARPTRRVPGLMILAARRWLAYAGLADDPRRSPSARYAGLAELRQRESSEQHGEAADLGRGEQDHARVVAKLRCSKTLSVVSSQPSWM